MSYLRTLCQFWETTIFSYVIFYKFYSCTLYIHISLLGWVLVACGFQGVGPSHLSRWIYVCSYSLTNFIISVECVVVSSLLFLILVIFVFSLLSAWLEGYFYWSFQRINFWFHWLFLFSASLIFAIMFFFWLFCVYFCSSLCVFSRYKCRLFTLGLSSFLI